MSLKKTEQYQGVRWLIRRDMAEVLEIEQRSFEFPWTEEDFLIALRQRNVIGTVYESERHLLYGFMLYELHPTSLSIINMAVAPEVRRTGVGRALLERLVGKLSQQKRTFIEAEIRESNLAAQLFLSHFGFRAVRTLRKQYFNGEDGYVFRYTRRPDSRQEVLDGGNRISHYDDP